MKDIVRNKKQGERICKNCDYFEMFDGDEEFIGFCKRHAPVLSSDRRTYSAGQYIYSCGDFPLVHYDGWCGDFNTEKGEWIRNHEEETLRLIEILGKWLSRIDTEIQNKEENK